VTSLDSLATAVCPSATPRADLPAADADVATAVQLSGRLVVVGGSATGGIALHDAASATPIGSALTGHAARITVLQVVRLGERSVLVSAAQDNAIRVWDLAVRAHGG
jgi:WD40 repeat protein